MKRPRRTTLRAQIQAALAAGYVEVWFPAGWTGLQALADRARPDLLDAVILDPPPAGLGQVAIGREVLTARGKRSAAPSAGAEGQA